MVDYMVRYDPTCDATKSVDVLSPTLKWPRTSFDSSFDDSSFDFHPDSASTSDHSSAKDALECLEDDVENLDDDDIDMDILAALHPRKKRIRNRRRVLIPRVLRNDIRRHLAQMFVNTLNAHDKELMYAFMTRYSTEDVRMHKHCPAPESISDVNRKLASCSRSEIDLTLVGIRSVVNYFDMLHEFMPDHVVRMEDVHVHTFRSSDHSVVRCRVQIEVTKLFDFCPRQIAQISQDRAILADREAEKRRQRKKRRCGDGGPIPPPSVNSIEFPTLRDGQISLDMATHKVQYDSASAGMSFKMFPEPIQIRFAGVLTMSLNGARQIETLDFGSPALVIF